LEIPSNILITRKTAPFNGGGVSLSVLTGITAGIVITDAYLVFTVFVFDHADQQLTLLTVLYVRMRT